MLPPVEFELLEVKIDQQMPAQIADFDSHFLEVEELEHWPIHKPTHQAKIREEAVDNADAILQHLARWT